MECQNRSPLYLAERMLLLPNGKQQKPTRELLNRPGTARQIRAPKLRMTRVGKLASAHLLRARIHALRRTILQSLTRKDIYTEEVCDKTAAAPSALCALQQTLRIRKPERCWVRCMLRRPSVGCFGSGISGFSSPHWAS